MKLLLLVLIGLGSAEGSSLSIDAALGYLSKHSTALKQDLIDLVAIPSISSLPEHSEDVLKAAQWVEKRLKAAGIENTKVLPTEAKTHQPVVYGDWLHAKGKPTVLIYGHYDVQPVDPLELWDNPPFEPIIKDDHFFGRGCDDDKGGVVPAIQAVEAYLKTAGELPVNVKFMFEGQEEVGSPNLAAFLQKHAKKFSADLLLSADGGQESRTQGILVLGLRGASAFEVEARTLSTDAHSGTFGGTVQNPNHALSRFIADLHFPNGSVAIPGFYDGVREITEEDKADLAAFTPFNLQEHLDKVGATEAYGEEGFSTLERTWHRPTCDVVGQYGGFTGTGVKTIVPGKATAKIACRLVPNQDPLAILERAQEYVESQQIPGTTLTFKSLGWAAPPFTVAKDLPTNRAAAKVLEDILGTRPLYYRVGGSIPAAAYMKAYLGLDMVMFAFGLPGNNIHAPNEKYGVLEFERSQEAYVKILKELSGAGEEAGASSDHGDEL